MRVLASHFWIAAVLLSVVMVSCGREEPEEQKKPEDFDVNEWENTDIDGDATMSENTIHFSVGESNETMRATTTIGGVTTLAAGDLVAVAVTGKGIYRTATEVIKLYRIASDGISLEYAGDDNKPFIWFNGSETVSIRAWSYGTSTNLSYTLTPPESFDFSLETNQQSNGYNELLYSKASDKSFSDGTVDLTLYHQLSRVIFNVTHERSGTLNIASTSVGSSSFPVAARFSVPTGDSNVGTWETKATYSTITPKRETTQSGYQATFSAVVFPKNYAQNSTLLTITNIDGKYVYNISGVAGATLAAGKQYNYTITVKDIKDIRKNPLWYMAEYRLAENATSFDTSTGWGVSYMRTYNNVLNIGYTYQTTSYDGYAVPTTPKKINGIAYHVPTALEFVSISGSIYNGNDDYKSIYIPERIPAKTLRSELCTFGYSNATKYKNGVNNTGNTGVSYQSYWGNYYGNYDVGSWGTDSNDGIRYAIRFLGTEFCSVWRYKVTGTIGSNRRTEITSRLIDPISPSDVTALNAKISEIESAQESFWTDNTWGSVKRTIYWGGHTANGNGRTYTANTNGHYATASARYYNLVSGSVTTVTDNYQTSTFGMDLLLFRDE